MTLRPQGERRMLINGKLVDAQKIDAPLQGTQHQRQRLGCEAWAAAGAVYGGVATRTGRFDPLPDGRVHGIGVEEFGACRHDVDSGVQ